ncbi:MAG: hypothetical protein H7323_10500 [Frankiales bacterium]|nr:hypothetical protein [Frankiales bacterium]
MSLPQRQPARALACAAAYLVAVAVLAGLIQLKAPGGLGLVLTMILAMGFLVPLAVVLPVPGREQTAPDTRPILSRDKGTRPPT